MLTVIIMLSGCLLFISLLLCKICHDYIVLVRRNEHLEDFCEDFRNEIAHLNEEKENAK